MVLPALLTVLALAVFYTARRFTHARHLALVGGHVSRCHSQPDTANDHSPLTGRSSPPVGVSTTDGWQVLFVRHLCDAEEALDRLERCGIRERAVHVLGNSAFAVRWRV